MACPTSLIEFEGFPGPHLLGFYFWQLCTNQSASLPSFSLFLFFSGFGWFFLFNDQNICLIFLYKIWGFFFLYIKIYIFMYWGTKIMFLFVFNLHFILRKAFWSYKSSKYFCPHNLDFKTLWKGVCGSKFYIKTVMW